MNKQVQKNRQIEWKWNYLYVLTSFYSGRIMKETQVKDLLCKISFKISTINSKQVPILMAIRSKAWVYGRSLAGIVGSNPARGMNDCLLWVLRVVR
jgi:hypothetical protein